MVICYGSPNKLIKVIKKKKKKEKSQTLTPKLGKDTTRKEYCIHTNIT